MTDVSILVAIGIAVAAYALLAIDVLVDQCRFSKKMKKLEEDYLADIHFLDNVPRRNSGRGEYIDGRNRAIYNDDGDMIWNSVFGIVRENERCDCEKNESQVVQSK